MDDLENITGLIEALALFLLAVAVLLGVWSLLPTIERLIRLLEMTVPNVRVRRGKTEIDLRGSVPKESQSGTGLRRR